ncbi:MAG: oligosaccharide flippase family protein [Thermoleophilaceae bacterium]|nr:oligosaccharide flippase family protein [Thermoleophilaceae bacterium]
MTRLRKYLSNGGLFHSSAQSVVSMGVTMALSLASGILTARLLGPSGRGELAAIITVSQTIGWIVSIGCFQAVVHYSAKHRESASDVVATWIAISVPAGLIGVLIGQALLGTLFRAQSDSTLEMARYWLLLMPLNPLSEALSGALVASRDFAATNMLRMMQQALSVAFFIALWLAGNLTVETALIAQAVVIFTYIVVLLVRVHRRVRIGRPRRIHASSGIWYAVRAHSSNVTGQVNSRFDLMLMPAFLPAAQIGLYAVAVSATSMIVSLASSLCQIVQPVAAADGPGSDRQVAKMFHATILLGVLLAAPVALLAPWLLTLVYSSAFEGATTALRLLAPGAVLLAMTNVLVSGLFGKGRPATGGFAQLPGSILMIVLLIMFLGSGGIELAAAVSTLTYGISVIVAAAAYLHFSDSTVRELFDLRPTARELIARLRKSSRAAVGPRPEAGGVR